MSAFLQARPAPSTGSGQAPSTSVRRLKSSRTSATAIQAAETTGRSVPRAGDNLDRLLGLLERARAEQARRAYPPSQSLAPYRALLDALKSA